MTAPTPTDGSPSNATPVAVAPGSVTAIRLLISHNLMGTVIGRQGLKIKHIQDVSGARMVASKDMLPQSTERVVEVQGTTEAIRVAVYEIAQCLLEDWERGQGTVLYHPGHTEGAGVLAAGGAGGLQPQGARRGGAVGGAAAGGYLAGAMTGLSLTSGAGGSAGASGFSQQRRSFNNGATGGYFASAGAPSSRKPRLAGSAIDGDAAAADAADASAVVTPGGSLSAAATSPSGGPPPAVVDSTNNMRTQNISIPADMVGCIIGKGGSKITEIRRLSGSRISIAKVAHDDSGERMFSIRGTPEANEKALFLLYTQLESEKERRTSAGNAGNGGNGGSGEAAGEGQGQEGGEAGGGGQAVAE